MYIPSGWEGIVVVQLWHVTVNVVEGGSTDIIPADILISWNPYILSPYHLNYQFEHVEEDVHIYTPVHLLSKNPFETLYKPSKDIKHNYKIILFLGRNNNQHTAVFYKWWNGSFKWCNDNNNNNNNNNII